MTSEHDVKASEERLRQVREIFDREIQPRLKSHLGGGKVVGVNQDGVVEVEFTGACTECAYRRNTIVGAIFPRLREIEGISGVSARGVAVTARQQQRVADQLQGPRGRRLLTIAGTGCHPAESSAAAD